MVMEVVPLQPIQEHSGAGGYALKELQPVDILHRNRFILKDCNPAGTGQSVRRTEQQRGTVTD